ncbi:MAG: transporter [Bacteroidetes bacterium]|nr:transporter [Bacteroidota bacterium]MDA0903208.1 transporter [Bacteroidota bacterium]MDA1242233.1 transporter [Bacteroidota bacterium]
MKLRLAFVALISLGASSAFAQTIETDRPDQTEAATLVPVGGIQLEAGVAGWTSSDAATTGYTLPTALLRYGLHERFELRVVGQRDQSQPNFIDMEEPWTTTTAWDVGAKVAGWRAESSQMCILAHYKHRPGSAHGGQVRVSYAKPLPKGFSLGTNLGVGWTQATATEAAQGALEYTLALGYAPSDATYLYVEGFGSGGGVAADAGFAWKATNLSQFDVSMGWAGTMETSYFALGWSKLWMPGGVSN